MGQLSMQKKMIQMGFNLVTILSEYRIMNDAAQNIVNEMKGENLNTIKSSSY